MDLNFHDRTFEISLADFKNFALSQVNDIVNSFSSSLQLKDNKKLVQAEVTHLITSIDLEEQKRGIKANLENLDREYSTKQVGDFRRELGAHVDKLLKNEDAEALLKTYYDINVNFRKKYFEGKVIKPGSSRFELTSEDNKIIIKSKEFQATSDFDKRLHKKTQDRLSATEFLAEVMALSKVLRDEKRSPNVEELAAIGFAHTLLAEGYTLPPLMVSLGQPGQRPGVHTYIAVTDPGPDNMRVTLQDNDILQNGVTVHTEYIDRRESKDKTIVEPYRFPSHIAAAKIRLMAGDEAPCSVYVGRPMFEGLPFDNSFDYSKGGKNFEEYSAKYRANTRDAMTGDEKKAEARSRMDGEKMFQAGLLKAVHYTAAACSSVFINGVSECKIGIENMTELQAITFLKAVRANIMRDEGVQYVSAAFNIYMPIYSDKTYHRLLTEPEDIAYMAISIAKAGGFDKVTWDGANNNVPSTPIVKALSHEVLVRLNSAAHSVGLLTYLSAGITTNDISRCVYSGTDGVGIGVDLHYLDPDYANNAKTGAFNPEKIKGVLKARNESQADTLGRSAAALARLDWAFSEGLITPEEKVIRDDLLKSLASSDKKECGRLLQKIEQIDSGETANEKQARSGTPGNKHIDQAKRIQAAILANRDTDIVKTLRGASLQLSNMIVKKDAIGIANLLMKPLDDVRNKLIVAIEGRSQITSQSTLRKAKAKEEVAEPAALETMQFVPSTQDLTACSLRTIDGIDSYVIATNRPREGLSEQELVKEGAVIIKPKKGDLPFDMTRSDMYTPEELGRNNYDTKVYQWLQDRANGKVEYTFYERMMVAVHDGIQLNALEQFGKGKKVVGIMGGHAMKRADRVFRSVTILCWKLAKEGFIIVSGGGPGAMEAANMGAYFADHSIEDLEEALSMLQEGNENYPKEFNNTAAADAVVRKFPGGGRMSLGVPTWLYGHEPYNRFAFKQAKFMSNAIREDILVNMCNAGIIFTPGAAGTRTEIFQYAVPNAYSTEDKKNFSKPMIFYTSYWLENTLYQTCLNIAQREDFNRGFSTGYSSKMFLVNEDLTDENVIINATVDIIKNFKGSEAKLDEKKAKEAKAENNIDEERAKKNAAKMAVDNWIDRDGLVVGFGSGSTVKAAIDYLATLIKSKKWNRIVLVPCSFMVRKWISDHPELVPLVQGLPSQTSTDVVIDGVDQSDAQLNLIKGHGGSLLQEKLLASRTKNYVIISNWTKKKSVLSSTIPIEVTPLAWQRVQADFNDKFHVKPELQMATQNGIIPFVTDNGNYILLFPVKEISHARSWEADLKSVPGVVEVGIFTGSVSQAYFGKVNDQVDAKIRVPARRFTEYLVSEEKQTAALRAVFEAVSKNKDKNPVVEVDLDLTCFLPFSRTVAGLRVAGNYFNIEEFSSDATDYLTVLPGYTPEAWDNFVTCIPGIVKKYPNLPWKSADAPDEKNNTVHSVFHTRFWKYPSEFLDDVVSPGLLAFEEKIIQLGGKIVFLSGRWTQDQAYFTQMALRNAKFKHPENLVIGNPLHDAPKPQSDQEAKIKLQQTVKEHYGRPVAVIDDRVANLEAVAKVYPDVLKVVACCPGYTANPVWTKQPHVISSFEFSAVDISSFTGAKVHSFAVTARKENKKRRRDLMTENENEKEDAMEIEGISPNDDRRSGSNNRRSPASVEEAERDVSMPIKKPVAVPKIPGKIRVGTFNVENLFQRFKFGKGVDPEKLEDEGLLDSTKFTFQVKDDDEKKFTGMVFDQLDADILALEEVENMQVLEKFLAQFTHGVDYRYRYLIHGNDQRGINVALVSRFPVIHCRSYRDELNADGKAKLFSRDCLEVRVDVDGKVLHLYVNHFKSMMAPKGVKDGRAFTHKKRVAQVEGVLEILRKNHPEGLHGNIVVAGDFNDYCDGPEDGESSVTKLVYHPDLENVLLRAPEREQWTHFYNKKNDAGEYKQLDFLLVSKDLSKSAANVESKPVLVREGQPRRANWPTHYEGIGWNRPKASDHCPLALDLQLL